MIEAICRLLLTAADIADMTESSCECDADDDVGDEADTDAGDDADDDDYDVDGNDDIADMTESSCEFRL